MRDLALRYGFDWAVAQAEEEIRAGKSVELAEPMVVTLPGRRRPSRIEKGSVTQPFATLERLDILLTSLRRAVVLPALLEQEILRFFAEAIPDAATSTEVVLEPADQEGASIVLSPTLLSERIDAVRGLEAALAALGTEARR